MRFRGQGIGLMVVPGNAASSASWSSYWTPQKPIGGETPTAWYNERSGNELIDSLGGAPIDILTRVLKKSGGPGDASISDNTALDIGNSDFTFFAKVKSELATAAAYEYICGKLIAGSVSGRYGFIKDITTGNLIATVQTSGGNALVTSTTPFKPVSGWLFLLMDVNQTTKKLRFFINNVQIGADVDWTGTISTLDNKYKFWIGAGNDGTGAKTLQAFASFGDVGICKRILTPTEQTAAFNGNLPSNMLAHWDCAPREDTKIYDFSGNYYNLTGSGLLSLVEFSKQGSKQAQNKGYTLYTDFPNKEWQVPNLDSGSPFVGETPPAGYTEQGNYAGSLTGLNGGECYLILSAIDRSNTTVSSYLARRTDLQNYYYAPLPTYYHSAELSNKVFRSYFNSGYEGKWFWKTSNRLISDLVIYNTNKSGADYNTIIKWSGEDKMYKFDTVVGPHICAISADGSKVLKFDDVHTFSLSLDGGTTYPISLVTTLSNCSFGFICENGNIAFADNTKIYYSDDNLATYQECTTLGIDGNPYVPGTLNNFRPWDYPRKITIDGTDMVMWGAYITGGTAEFVNVNEWYTTDNFVTVKSCYKFGVSLPNLTARHIHSTNYFPDGDCVYVWTGDDMLDAVIRNQIIKGVYDTDTDTFTWTYIGGGDRTSIWEGISLITVGNYVYTVGETPAAYKGIRRILKSDIANLETNQERIFVPELYGYQLNVIDGMMVFTQGDFSVGGDLITFSEDYEHFFTKSFTELPKAGYSAYYLMGKLANGYFVFGFLQQGETVDNYTKGSTLLIKPSVIS